MLTVIKVKNTIEKHRLLNAGDKVVVAISGGPDSVCLLHLLHKLAGEYGIELFGAHLNHSVRGIEAQKDAQYVNNLCEKLGIMCFIKSVGVEKYARENGYSLEEAGRILRYQFFDEISEKTGASKVAVAHNQNDQAETVLMRLIRGAGLHGLSSIRYNRGKIIRPLLDISRNEIESYCLSNELRPRIDQTNLLPIYHRNKIRLDLIPYLENEYNPNIIEGLARTASLLRTDNDFLELQARDFYNLLKGRDSEGCLFLPVLGINKLHLSLKSRVLRLAIEEVTGRQEALEYKHIASILDLADYSETGKKLILPEEVVVSKSYSSLVFCLKKDNQDNSFCHLLNIDNTTYVPELGLEFKLQLVSREDLGEIPREPGKKAFDWDKVTNQLIVRSRRDGDKFVPSGLGGHKKLKDFFIDLKVEQRERNLVPLVCDGDRIMWVVGYRISDIYKVTKETKHVLIVEYIKN